jgi:ribosomal 50S subunit-recycling heat shock protein
MPDFFCKIIARKVGYMRLDKFLKVSRLIKRRTVAHEACEKGRVTINGKIAKPSSEVKIGDIIVIGFGEKKVSVKVLYVAENVSKVAATDLYEMIEE